MEKSSRELPQQTVGLDLGDRWSRYVVLDREGGLGGLRSERKRGVAEDGDSLSRVRPCGAGGGYCAWVSAGGVSGRVKEMPLGHKARSQDLGNDR